MNNIGLLATYPPRKKCLLESLPTILPQLDLLYIYCNQYGRKQLRELVEWAGSQESGCQVTLIDSKAEHSDIKDMGKFWKLGDVDGYVFLLDDDLAYPPDYCQRHIKAINLHGCITTVHGRIIKNRPLANYFGDTRSIHYRRPLSSPEKVDIAGTGTAAFKSSYLPDSFRPNFVSYSWYRGMADIWFAMQVFSHKLEIRCIPRDSGWLTDVPADEGSTLYEQAVEDDSRHCAILNKYL